MGVQNKLDMNRTNAVEQTILAYDRIASTYANAWFDRPPLELLSDFINHVERTHSILDAACGPGRDTNFFLKQGLATVGIDISAGMLAEARARVPEGVFAQMDIRHMAFPKNCFGGIWACAVFVHIPPDEIASTLRSFYTVLANKGILFVALHEAVNSESACERISEDGRYFVAYSEKQISDELFHSGFNSMTTKRQISHQSIYGKLDNAVHWLNIWAQK